MPFWRFTDPKEIRVVFHYELTQTLAPSSPAVVFLVLFGSKRLPDSARSLGRSLRIFKSEIQELNKDDNPGNKKSDANTDK